MKSGHWGVLAAMSILAAFAVMGVPLQGIVATGFLLSAIGCLLMAAQL